MYVLIYCVYAHVCHHTRGGQRTTYDNWFSLDSRFLRSHRSLDGKCLYPLDHLSGPASLVGFGFALSKTRLA